MCILEATRSCALHSRTCFVSGFAQVEERTCSDADLAYHYVEMHVQSEGSVFS